jgi:chromosome segregation ATPase
MAQQTNVIEESYDRLQEAVESVTDEIGALQKRFDKRRKSFERDTRKRVSAVQRDLKKNDLYKRAESLRKQTTKRIEGFQKDLRKTPVVKRAEKLRKDANKRFESTVDDLLSTLQIASRSDVRKLDRKLTQINRKLSAIDGRKSGRKSAA